MSTVGTVINGGKGEVLWTADSVDKRSVGAVHGYLSFIA